MKKTLIVLLVVSILVTIVYQIKVKNGNTQPNNIEKGYIYFNNGDSITEQNLTTGESKIVLELTVLENATKTYRTKYDVSRNKQMIAYLETKNANKDCIVIFDRIKKAITWRKNISALVIFPLSLSPNNEYIAYVYNTDTNPVMDVVRISDSKNILSVNGVFNGPPSWSLDSSKLCFVDENLKSVLIDVFIKHKERISGGGDSMWSPDGKYIYVGDFKIWDVHNKIMQKLNLPKEAIVTGWSSNSKWLTYTKDTQTIDYTPLLLFSIKDGISKEINDISAGSDSYPTLLRN